MNDKVVMPLWTFCLFIVVMNTTMFNVSIPTIIQDLQITADLGSWVISSYSIGYALSTVIYSRLSDLVPIRRLLTVGLITLGLASVFGLFAHHFTALLITRILQSAGSGSMAGLGLVLASRYVPAERRGAAIAMISAGSAMAFGLGPIVGGLISQYWGWNGLFGVTCLVLLVLPVLLRLLPKEMPRQAGFDVPGAALTIINAASLLIAVTGQSLIWLGISLVSFVVHALHLKRAKSPFINPQLIRMPGYGKLVAIGFCILVLNLGNLFLMPLALANLFHQSALSIGLFIAPGAVFSAFCTRFVGRWIDRYGNIRFLLIGHAIMAVTLGVFALELSASPAVILLGYLCFSPAFSATMASLNNETSRILPPQWIGSGMGLLQLIQFFGGSVSVAVCGLLLHAQKDIVPAVAYKHVYGVLLVVCLCSLGVLMWYRGSRSRSQVISEGK
ncbi:MFS transporter [Bacillus sp. FJAT-27264]|uniref:MFS transporter n=1 Tax=Paenibacillus sp. (strain DSM 101736 / FJAT-27264) TaxID=1850362 RepID=UPI000807E328|nr:MFS transporter [Bacillus sp. FJAT-27264]OBZ08418.1 MFS transporter [Bacillus sp. FJAT-27264]